MKTILVAGGCGFIGSNFIRYVLENFINVKVVNVDCLSYSGNVSNLFNISKNIVYCDRYKFYQEDIRSRAVGDILKWESPDIIINFAAETHVDRSIYNPSSFLHNNTIGTFNLLEASRTYWNENKKDKANFRFIQVSTDEVFGSCEIDDVIGFGEHYTYNPSNPYSASKAAADHFVKSYFKTYGFPSMVTHSVNNYGPYQYPEKLIPLVILNAIEGKEIPVYGNGMQKRSWIYVVDHCEALCSVMHNGVFGESYNIGTHSSIPNIGMIKSICNLVDFLLKREVGNSLKLIKHVSDRPGHDLNYLLDSSKIKKNWVGKAHHLWKLI